MSHRTPESRRKPFFRRWSQVQLVTTLLLMGALLIGAAVLGELLDALVALAVALVAYVAYRAYWDNE